MKHIGRPIDAIKKLCQEFVFNDRLIEKLANIAASPKHAVRDKIRAIEVLLDRGFGKAEQAIDITQYDGDKPSTDVLIETLTALRSELDSLRKGAELEKGK